MFKNGTPVLLQLEDKEELMGEWMGSPHSEYESAKYLVELANAAQIVILMIPPSGPGANPNDQGHPQRTIIPANDHNNFNSSIYVWRDKILFAKEIIEGSQVYNMWKQAVTGLSLPPKSGIVLPFMKPNKPEGVA